MNFVDFCTQTRVGQLWSILQGQEKILKMLRTIITKENQQMSGIADIKVAEEAQGERIAKLEALTDAIFQRLQSAPSDDPAVQEVLAMIAAHNSSMDETVARDTPQDTTV